jgi:membrane peptidoglycan carboxypeptidase
MVGSRGYDSTEVDGKFNVATALRQPGSSFKPFIYAAAFEQGFTDQTVIFDLPIQFSTSCPANNYTTTSNGSCYSPDNYDGKFMGPMTLRNALGGSRNIPAVQMMYLVGPAESIRFARTLGINSLQDVSRYGLTLVLGGGEVSLLDMTSAYGVFANDGVKVDSTAINRIEDSTGRVIYEHKPVGSQVMSSDAARRLSSVLSDNVARAPLFGSNSALNFGSDRPVAAKSGTTNSNKDAWMVGYTPDVAIGVWTGNNDNTPMKKGSIISAPTWREVMNTALGLYGYSAFPQPLPIASSTKPVLRGKWWGNEVAYVDSISGKRATEFTPNETLQEIVLTEPHSILHWVRRGDPTGPVPSDPSSDSQYSRWEAAVRGWVANNPSAVPATPPIPTGTDDVHKPEYQPNVSITETSIQNNAGENQLLVKFNASDNDLKMIRIIVNGNILAELPAASNQATVTLPDDIIGTGSADLTVEAIDNVWNRGNAKQRVTL